MCIIKWILRLLRRLLGIKDAPRVAYTFRVNRPTVTLTDRTRSRQVFVRSFKRAEGEKPTKVTFVITNLDEKPSWLSVTVRRHRSGHDMITLKRVKP